MEVLLRIAQKRQSLHGATTAARRVVDIGRPWLRFLGWWREPSVSVSVSRRTRPIRRRGCAMNVGSPLRRWSNGRAMPRNSCVGASRRIANWVPSRPETSTTILRPKGPGDGPASRWPISASALRGFLRYAATQGICADRLAVSICRPRLYQQESLPYAPDWSDVQRMLADADTDRPRDIRDRAILLLLAVYGMRSGEVAALRLDQIDWPGRILSHIFRLKRRQPQIYPLLPSVAEALAVYIDTVRPPSSCPEVFLCMQAPRRPDEGGKYLRCRQSQICRPRSRGRPPGRTRPPPCLRDDDYSPMACRSRRSVIIWDIAALRQPAPMPR